MENQTSITEKDIRLKEKENLNTLINSLFKITLKNATAEAYVLSGGDLRMPASFRHAKQLLSELRKSTDIICKTLTIASSGKQSPMPEFMGKYTSARNSFSTFIKSFYNIVEIAIELDKKQLSQIKSENDKILKLLESMSNDVSNWMDYGEDFKGWFNNIIFTFELNSEVIALDLEVKESMDSSAKSESVTSKKVVSTEPSKEEQSRRQAIKDARDLYKMFCLDFMRDLQAQYSLSSRDLYEDFINNKFKKFTEKFSWITLDDTACDVSIGQAREAYAQIMYMINKISEISESSYVINTFS